MRIAFVDTLGLCYDGTTLDKRGLGGSESAVILLSKQLAKVGFDVTVFNDCTSDDTSPGVYDGVVYRPLGEVETCEGFDVLIGSRSVAAFASPEIRQRFKTFSYMPDFTSIQQKSRYKVLWMHDTFCDGDDLIEHLVLEGRINEIFTLSDFHLGYVTSCDHGRKRMYEVLKRHVFQTRNGIGNMNPGWVDVLQKDPNQFVYNSSLTKGMVPLVKEIWPRVKAQLPDAKLTVIGGFYRFREGHHPDQQEIDWRQMVAEYGHEINFTGVIPQQEISNILRTASFMIYPCAFPETFGISTLEALAHNVPIITCNFGAMEETAIDAASYKIPYSIEPNGLYPWISLEDQVNRFVDMTVRAYHDRYLHQQKMYACNAIKDVCGWDSVAKQWKQHLYHKLGEFLPLNEYKEVQAINHKVRSVFGRRFTNLEELQDPRNEQQRIGVITAVYNAENYIDKCIRSVAAQDYDNYTMYIIDDASTDNTVQVARETIASLPEELSWRFTLLENKHNVGAVANHFRVLDDLGTDDLYMLLDGDDWLVNDPNLFHYYNNLYREGAEFSYGSCWSLADNINLIAQPYPPEIRQARDYRNYRFNWNMPYTHLRTFHSKLVKDLCADDLKVNGRWPKAGGDTALFYYLIERADPDKVVAVARTTVVYNDLNPINDYKINGSEQTATAEAIIGKKPAPRKFSVVVPTMWRCQDVFKRALNYYIASDRVDDIVIINNDVDKMPQWPELSNPKVRMITRGSNIFCNPAWNLGARVARNDLLCFANDDIEFDPEVFNKVEPYVTPANGVTGMITGESHFNHPPSTDFSISIKQWVPGDNTHGFGQLFFIHKDNWEPIIDGLDLYYGDDFIFHNNLRRSRPNHLIYNFKFYSPFAQTTSDPEIRGNRLETELPIYLEWFNKPLSQVEPVKEPAPVEPERDKTIMIAIPCKNDIEADTFKSIYDLEIPKGYRASFQYFYGYAVDQVRNLIASWAQGHDYLFAVDHDVTFAPDTLKKLLSHDKPIVGGIYRQRNATEQHIEVYDLNCCRHDYSNLHDRGLVEVGGLGFGCVLVKSHVFADVGYPQFVYHQALDHAHTFSEDLDFCRKAREKGHSVWCDTSILCGHIGQYTFEIQHEQAEDETTKSLRALSQRDLLPEDHADYLYKMRAAGTKPKVIYDIGACVLHWTNVAKRIWPNSTYVAFDAMDHTKFLYDEAGMISVTGSPLYKEDGAEVTFYENTTFPGGNSIYRENTHYSPDADHLFPESGGVVKTTRTLDSLVAERNLPMPDLIKMDIQGAEMDALMGAQNVLSYCNDIILELQHVEYNKGAPHADQVIDYVKSLGFEMVSDGAFCNGGADGDFHFRRINTHRNQ